MAPQRNVSLASYYLTIVAKRSLETPTLILPLCGDVG